MTATIPTSTPLDAALEEHRRGLTGYCYRMLGSMAEADDAVQETLIRAWRAQDDFEGRSSLRTWLYRIAHNVCIDMLRSPQRRARPMDLGPSAIADLVVLGDPLPEATWVGPVLDDKVIDLDGDPADVAVGRESIRLAFVAALGHLTPGQRGALILCDVLRWPAAEAAEALDTTTASITSALQRARATLAERRSREVIVDLGPDDRDLAARYAEAFERYDVDAIVALVHHDVVMSMPPWDLWLQGPEQMAAWLRGHGSGCAGSRLVPIALNGTAGFGSYRPAGDGRWEPFGLQVLDMSNGVIVGHHNFIHPEWFPAFGLPTELAG